MSGSHDPPAPKDPEAHSDVPPGDVAPQSAPPPGARTQVPSGVERLIERFSFTATRPVAVAMVFLAILVFGAFSAQMLPLSLMPDISYPKLTVRTDYEGAAPAEVENNVSRPLEEVLGVVTGVTRIESVSRAGYSDVILEFGWDTDMDDANQDVLEILDQVTPSLPDGVDQPLILRYDPTLDPVLTLSLEGNGDRYAGEGGLGRLRRVADQEVRRLLEPVEGVAAVRIKGGLEEQISVELEEGQLRRTGIGIDTVMQRLSAENINLAGGQLEDGRTRYLVRTVNEFRDLDDIGEIVITRRNDRDVRLRDLAIVSASHKDREVITRVDGVEAVEVEVYKEADANIVEMAALVRDRIEERVGPRLEQQHEASISVSSDRSRFIQSSIDEVRNTALFGGLLAVAVLFFFLRDLRSTAIVAVSIPVSILITFAPLSLAGVSLNIMSLGGLALGIGMLVDNSIVVLESIHRCRQEGDDLVRATLRGVSEVGGAVFAATLTSIAVFFPMVFVEGVAGQMFGDLGLAVVFSLLASLAVALFLIPMLASRRFGAEEGGAPSTSAVRALGRMWRRWASWADFTATMRERGAVARVLLLPYVLLRLVLHFVFELLGKVVLSLLLPVFGLVVVLVWGVFKLIGLLAWAPLKLFGALIDGVERAYPSVIRWSLRNRVVVYLVGLSSLGFVGWGAAQLDTELIPAMHQGEFTAELSLPVGTPLASTDETVRPLETIVAETTPHLGNLTTTIGSEPDQSDGAQRGEHTARMRVTLKDDQESTLQSRLGLGGDVRARAQQIEQEALQAVREAVSGVPDLEVNISRPVLFSFKTPVEVEIRGFSLDELGDATRAVEQRLAAVPGLRDVKGSIQPGSPEIHIRYDRDELARRGLDIRTVAERVRDEVQGAEATKFNRIDRKIPVQVRLSGIREASLEDLRNLVVNPGGARPVPLSAVAALEIGRGPNEIRRIGQQRVGLVTANVEGIGLGTAAGAIEAAMADVELPASVTPVVTGQSEEWETSSRSLLLALGLSVFLVYVIMASQFESLIYPFLILFTIPLAFVGVVAVALLLDMPLSVVVFLGAIMLAGIVVNNAIVLVDYVGKLKQRGYGTEEALEIAGKVRLRPILMTTLTTVLGLMPMALGLGDGAEIRTPMAITVISGLAFSTVLTLIVIPTLYAGVDRLRGATSTLSTAERLDAELAQVRPEQLTAETFEAPQAAGPNEDEGEDGQEEPQ
ncbi:MAG: efflux RND transporter permease subunit [Nannocystaceae bacterium]|nr:efflux RND transporter permease subunit [bacterium]